MFEGAISDRTHPNIETPAVDLVLGLHQSLKESLCHPRELRDLLARVVDEEI
jgi:hypothetical protein